MKVGISENLGAVFGSKPVVLGLLMFKIPIVALLFDT